jgi:succinate dehydrogenase / fumarate reductase cytochrome b subunit
MNLLTLPFRTTLGAKYVMALTGFGLVGFVLAHMIGNLLLFAGPDALNTYAEGLKAHPTFLWSARTGLLFIFLLHLFLAFRLWEMNRAARPTRYVYEDTVKATWASRHMMLTGLVLLAFIVYHLAHFTFGVVAQAEVRDPATGQLVRKNYLDLREVHESKEGRSERHNVYQMVVAGFSNPWITLTYLAAQVFLCLHLWHGGSSWFQSLGLNHPQYNPVIRNVGPVVALVVLLGNCAMPLAVLAGLVR